MADPQAAPPLAAVILAAGEGKRMRSRRAKVLHPVAGLPMVSHILALTRQVGARRIAMVVGHLGEQVREALAGEPDLTFVDQKEQRGTGHALIQARDALVDSVGDLLVLYGDTPLLSAETLQRLLTHHRRRGAAATLLTAMVDDPKGYGRIIRQRGAFARIVEERDASPAERAVREINAGVYCFRLSGIFEDLEKVRAENDQGEYYLPDVLPAIVARGGGIEAVQTAHPQEILGINDRKQLALVDALFRQRILERLMIEGVTILDPGTTYIDAGVGIGSDTVIHPGVMIGGRTRIGEGCLIGFGCQLADAEIGAGVTLRPYCVVLDSRIEDGALLGPFAHLRPHSVVGAGAKVGNFVELKKSVIGRKSKVPHLSYVGDATVGEGVNVGAGTITCNYDGVAKHETKIGDGAFVGTNTSLVAPLTIGEGAYIGAGSVITKDVPPGALAVTRAPQITKENWATRRKEKARKKEDDKGERRRRCAG